VLFFSAFLLAFLRFGPTSRGFSIGYSSPVLPFLFFFAQKAPHPLFWVIHGCRGNPFFLPLRVPLASSLLSPDCVWGLLGLGPFRF